MRKNWLIKWVTPLLAFALMSACGTANNNNEAPQEPDTNAPVNEEPNDMEDTDQVPEEDVNEDLKNNEDRENNEIEKQEQDPDMSNNPGGVAK